MKTNLLKISIAATLLSYQFANAESPLPHCQFEVSCTANNIYSFQLELDGELISCKPSLSQAKYQCGEYTVSNAQASGEVQIENINLTCPLTQTICD